MKNEQRKREIESYLFSGIDISNYDKISGLEYKNNIDLFKRNYDSSESLEELANEFINKWEEIFNQYSKKYKNLVIPISGGLDSRLILASALNYYNAHNIQTFTFGTESSFDYDFGNIVAKKAGTKHLKINLKNIDPKLLIYNDSFIQGSSDFLGFPPIVILRDNLDMSVPIVSGLMGDPLFGSHYQDINKNQIKNVILKKENNGSNFSLFPELLEKYKLAFLEETNATKFKNIEVWDINYRQKNFVMSQVLYKDFIYEAPFLDKTIISMSEKINAKFLKKSRGFHEILINSKFNEFFSLPTKNYLGSGIPKDTFTRMKYILMRGLFSRIKTLKGNKMKNYYFDEKLILLNMKKNILKKIDYVMESKIISSKYLFRIRNSFIDSINSDPNFFKLLLGLKED